MKIKKRSRAASFPFPVLAVLVFLFLGFMWNLWHPGWLVFLTVPVYYYAVNLIEATNNNEKASFWKLLPYPLFCSIVYICLGFFLGLWHPGWIIFLTIPIWSFFVNPDSDDDEDVMKDDDFVDEFDDKL